MNLPYNFVSTKIKRRRKRHLWRDTNVNECEDADLNTCSAEGGVCTDKKYDFDCACVHGFFDQNSDKPGTVGLDFLKNYGSD